MSFVAKAGKYDQRIRVYGQTTSPTRNADGQKQISETLIARRWASVLPVTGTERVLASQTQADVTHAIRVRSDTLTRTFTPKHWIKLSDGTRLDIKSVFDIDMRRVELQLDCNLRVE